MYIKRLYDQDKLLRNTRDAHGYLLDPGKEEGAVLEVHEGAVRGVRILHTSPTQKFTPNLLDIGQEEGWLSREGSMLLIDGEQGVLLYQIQREPGYVCCFCEETNADGYNMQAHVEACHSLPSPDSSNPHGYRLDNFYLCIRKD